MKYLVLLGLFCSQISSAQTPHMTVVTGITVVNPIAGAIAFAGIGIWQICEMHNSVQQHLNSQPKPMGTYQRVMQDQSQMSSKVESIQKELDDLRLKRPSEMPVCISQEDHDYLNLKPQEIVQKTVIEPKQFQTQEQKFGDYEFQSQRGEFRDALMRQYEDLQKVEPKFGKQFTAREIGLHVTEAADQSYAMGDENDAQFYCEVGKGMLDIAVGLDPVTGFGRSTFELFTGRNLITGGKLTSVERSFAFLGVMTGGMGSTVKAAGRMWHVFEGAKRLHAERKAIQAAIREGQILADKVGHLLPGMTKNHRIIGIHTAEHINQTVFSKYVKTPPMQLGSHVIEFQTVKPSQWVRVHGLDNQARGFIMRRSAIEGLNPEQIAKKFALPDLPKFVSDVHIPAQTTLLRGNIQNLGRGLSGDVQYFIKRETRVPREWFTNMRSL